MGLMGAILFFFMEDAALDVDLHLHIAQAAERKAEEVIVGIVDIVAVES